MSGHLSDLIRRTDIERKARAIDDPIQRLRHIRRATAVDVVASRRPSRRQWIVSAGLAAGVLPLLSDGRYRGGSVSPRAALGGRPATAVPEVWPVEHTADYDLYSNGLRIENLFTVSNEPRSFVLMFRNSGRRGPRRSRPMGIVFHTTESDQAPFESGQKPALQRIGREVLLYVRNKRAYHFLIDRFGRVHRIVAESDAANHAGHAIWADGRWIYLDLNAGFLGVAFEASMQGDDVPATPAQLRSGRALTEVLRATHNLPAENCVTHAQVSVNPSNMRIGWHTDWANRFPFAELGLPNNYLIPNPSVACFGFQYDDSYLNSSSPDMRRSLAAADEGMRQSAAERGLSASEYRSRLRQSYTTAQATLRPRGGPQENEDEQE
jgi:N-acetylmuramoyl-L-alanine amidase